MLIECANGEKMGSNARRSPPSDYLLPTLYTSCIEDYIRSMEGDLPIFSMFPSPAEATDASWRETNSSGLERDTPNHSQEQPHESVSLHSAHDLTLPMLSASPDIAALAGELAYINACTCIKPNCAAFPEPLHASSRVSNGASQNFHEHEPCNYLAASLCWRATSGLRRTYGEAFILTPELYQPPEQKETETVARQAGIARGLYFLHPAANDIAGLGELHRELHTHVGVFDSSAWRRTEFYGSVWNQCGIVLGILESLGYSEPFISPSEAVGVGRQSSLESQTEDVRDSFISASLSRLTRLKETLAIEQRAVEELLEVAALLIEYGRDVEKKA
ncbi:hypothetical protein PMIN01_11702 [Paraphaeosphaeria minitans]|uniref:Uncharacterized protein n=1 Tax=Paraphaeosphaeria minitans TaxID=565426 RepID=A0A9P6G8Q2_9PLEO|nr:hypothetical protein PMIN01_11702 [Paraphaeosphaeria minitans]